MRTKHEIRRKIEEIEQHLEYYKSILANESKNMDETNRSNIEDIIFELKTQISTLKWVLDDECR